MATADTRLTYWREPRQIWTEFRRNPDPKDLVEGFGDASFAPETRRPMQCVQVCVEGNLTAWGVSKQAFMAQSSCEAEMIALMDLANFTLSMAHLVDELLQKRAERHLAGDNIAALAIYGGTAAHWRTRHLRIRAKAFQERCQDGAVPAYHVAGEWNPADLGTKSLAATRHWKLCDLVGLVTPKHELESSYTQAKAKPSLQQCIKAVVLACCLGTVRGQPTQDTHDGSSDRLLLGVLVLIVIAAIALWEAGRHLMGRMRTFSQLQVTTDRSPPPRPPVEPQGVGPDRQPDAEDDLADLPPLHPVEAELEREERERQERERQLAEEQVQALYEEGLRRRGARVYGPEPDFEPPRPPSPPVPVDIEPPPRQVQGPEVAEHRRDPNLSRIEMQRPVGGTQRPPSPPQARRPEPPQRQQPLEQVIMYADDIAVVEPERRYADRGPPRLGGSATKEGTLGQGLRRNPEESSGPGSGAASLGLGPKSSTCH